jgi:hypothetical protein
VEDLELDHCGVFGGSHVGILGQQSAAFLGLFPVEDLVKLLCESHGELGLVHPMLDHVGLAHAVLRIVLEQERVYAGIPVVGSVEDLGLPEGLAELVSEDLVEGPLVFEDRVEGPLVFEDLVEGPLVFEDLVEGPLVFEDLELLVLDGFDELVPEDLELVFEDLDELVPEDLELLGFVGCSGSLNPSSTFWILGLWQPTNLSVQLLHHYIVLWGSCLSKSGARSLSSSFCLLASELHFQLR